MTIPQRSYLERYRAGEYEAVWRELTSLGADVRREPAYSDARAVARETMTRVRHNVELLATRLQELGFRFLQPDEVIVAPTPELIARLDSLEAEVGPIPLSVRAFYETVGSVCFMGSHPRLSGYAETPSLRDMVDGMGAAIAEHAPGGAAAAPVAPVAMAELPPQLAALFGKMPADAQGTFGSALALVQELMRRVQEVQEDSSRTIAEGEPPSERLRANHRLAEALHLQMSAGAAAKQTAGRQIVSDPLVVWAPYYDEPDAYHEFGDPDDPDAKDEEGWTGRYVIDIAPDAYHKANYSGGGPYQIAFPDPAADAPVLELGVPSFVGYLRECFRWGGFPGLAEERDPPTDELARLTEGLLPI